MHPFRDNASPPRTWELRVSVAEALDVRQAFKDEAGKPLVDLARLFENNFQAWTDFTANIDLFAEVLYVLCKDQVEKAGLTKRQFWSDLLGDALGDAAVALYQELVLFCPNPKARPNLRKVMEKAEQIQEKVLASGAKMLDEIDMDQEAAAVVKTLTTSLISSTNAPAS